MLDREDALTAFVDLRLTAACEEQLIKLPGAGSRSLLDVFDGQQIGAVAVTADGADLTPGSRHEGVELAFWADEARSIVAPGGRFTVWYGGTVGDGQVRSVGWEQAK